MMTRERREEDNNERERREKDNERERREKDNYDDNRGERKMTTMTIEERERQLQWQ